MKKLFTLTFILFSFFAEADYWTQKANFPGGARIWAASFSIGNKGYVGTGSIGNIYYHDFWEWDQTSNAWTQKTNFPGIGREGAVGFSIGNKGYIATGWDGSNFTLNSYHKDLWEWDQATNSWLQKADLPGVERYVATGFSIGTKGYVGLGLSVAGTYLNDLWEYDPATDTWIQKTSFNSNIDMVAGFTVNANYYMGTGHDISVVHNDFWEWNSITNIWTQKANFPALPRCDASSFSICGKGYLGIGDNWNNITLTDFWQYDPAVNQWIQKASFATGERRRSADFSINTKGYIGLGMDSVPSFFSDFWEYTPDSACATGIEELPTSNIEFTILPNPAKDYIVISCPLEGKESIEITITNVAGKKVHESNIQHLTSDFRLPTSDFSKGIYFIEVTNGKQKAVKKFVKE